MLKIDEQLTPEILLQEAENAKAIFNQLLLEKTKKGHKPKPFLFRVTVEPVIDGDEYQPVEVVIPLHPKSTIRQFFEMVVKGKRTQAQKLKENPPEVVGTAEEINATDQEETEVVKDDLLTEIEKAESKKK